MDQDRPVDLIRITLAHMDSPRWDEQKDAVKATGATHQNHSKGTWIIETDRDALPVDTINRLYEIAAEYGTHVRIIIGND
ncbi:hypothetical protein Q5530_15690 [Saccharothrix sp. BKS2]|uniref:hypothetical protein n=1 Tax=Saccharothrix sp. BKS2 TaxID=3064400 RepID=UPI0039E750A7